MRCNALSKIAIVALSIDESIARNKIMKTIESVGISNFNIELYLFTQGFKINEITPINIRAIQDDYVYNKGLSISEIRDYFVSFYRSMLSNYDYIYFVDDDTSFKDESLSNIIRISEYMDDNKSVGLVNSFNGKFKNEFEWISPMKVGTRSGIMVRSSGSNYDLIKFGGQYKIRYYEESYLALNYYINGYDCKRTNNSISTRTKKGSGITDRLRDKYGYYIEMTDELVSGWTVARDLGYYIPNKRYNDHFHLGEFTDLCENSHSSNRKW